MSAARIDHVTSPDEATVDVLVGTIGRAHGIRGELSVHVRTDEPERRFAAGAVLRTSRGALTVAATRWHQSRLLVRFEEVPDRTAAEQLRGLELRMDVAADERPDDPEEYYDHQLVGLQGVARDGRVLGQVAEVLHLPMQDMLVLRHEGRDQLVPFVADIVPVVDLAAGRVVVEDLPGLLDESRD
jgi:16S rRNA processing protein RimM